jgi:hypothetical protein
MLAVALPFFIAVAVTEAVVEALVEAVIFERIRAWLEGDPEKPRLVGILARCGYCQSFWVGMAVAWGLGLGFGGRLDLPGPVETTLAGLLVWRGSNFWHDLWSRVRQC